MHMIKFSAELQNADISPVTLLESDSITFHDKEVILSAILKNFGTVIRNICSGVSLQYRYVGGQLELLHYRPVALGKKGHFCKYFLKI